ncbi:hypothetical protein AC579_6517 [Pseudocercospora musae]|uniref:Uncharacterized protein n=1 Tax=Pseudocercospora musae TaxID=113226 RepID=A0A139I3P5_9PEZI|nr:hypothetical protein AC579_6517 [Pseudocercospora musae]
MAWRLTVLTDAQQKPGQARRLENTLSLAHSCVHHYRLCPTGARGSRVEDWRCSFSTPTTTTTSSMPFDIDGGLVFKEDTIRLPACRHDLQHQSLFVQRRQQSRSKHGTRSLAKTAINALLNHMSNLKVDALRPLPQHMVEKLWTDITRTGADSLHAWQVFAKTGHFGRKFVKTFSIPCVQCSCRFLQLAVKAPLCNQSSWLTTLTICDPSNGIAQILSLAKLNGLQNLYVQSNSPPSQPQEATLSDRILRALATEARNHGALSQLETLFVDNQRDVTFNSVQYLNHFPALTLFCAHNCSFPKRKKLKLQIQGTGWHLDNGDDEAGSFCHYMTLQHAHNSSRLPWSTSVHTFLQHRRDHVSQDDRPILDVEVYPYWTSKSYPSVPFNFEASVDRVVCLLRDQESIAKTMPVPEPPMKRRKLNTKKAEAFGDLLHGFT